MHVKTEVRGEGSEQHSQDSNQGEWGRAQAPADPASLWIPPCLCAVPQPLRLEAGEMGQGPRSTLGRLSLDH